MSISIQLRLFSAAILLVTVLATPQSFTPNGIRFSKLLSEKSDLLKFTSISNSPPEARFHNVYNKAEEVVPSRQSSSQRVVEYPEARVVTRAGPGEEFVRIGQSQVGVEDPDETLTQINHKPVSGRTQVTALRQSSGKRLNISPVFPGKDSEGSSIRRQSVIQQEDNQSEGQNDAEDSTTSPDFEDEDTEEEAEVTTVQNTELTRETDPPSPSTTTVTPTPESVTRNASSVTVLSPAPRVTIFDNRTESTTTASSFNPELDNENFLVDAFHRKGHFPDFEDVPTHLATAESNQPARVNVRPASSGKDYEYEYIYYYYDDEDDDNSTAAKPAVDGAVGVPKADLTGVKPSVGLESEKLSGSKFNADPSNSLDSQRGQKSFPLVPVASNPQPLGNSPIVLKQSNLIQSGDDVQAVPTAAFPQVPRSGSVPITPLTTPAAPTLTVPTRAAVQQSRFSPQNNPAQIPEQPHNRFSPPVKTEFIDEPSVPVTRFPAPTRSQNQGQFSRERLPAPEILNEPVSVPQTRFPVPTRSQNQGQFSRERVPAPVVNQEIVHEPTSVPQTRFPVPTRSQNQGQFSRERVPAPVVNQEIDDEPVSVPQTRFPAPVRSQELFSRTRAPTPAPAPEKIEKPEAPVQPPRFSAPTRSENLFSRPRVVPPPVEPTPNIRNKAQSQQAQQNDFAPPIIQIQLISTEAPVEVATPRKPTYKETPSGRRINSPRRLPASADPENHEIVPQPPVSTTLAPVVVSEAPAPAPAPRNPSLRGRFPSRSQTGGSQQQDQSRVPVTATRSQQEPIVEIPAPELSTVSPKASGDETRVRDNFARQKSINDLYALTRLHQLAINTRVPNRKLADNSGLNHRGPPPKQSGGFINSAEVTTHFPEDNMLQSESTTISSYAPPSFASSGDFQRLVTTTEEAPASSSTTEDSEQQRPGLRPRNNRFRGRNRGTSTTTTEAAPRAAASPNRFAGRRRPSTPAPSPISGAESGDESAPSAAPQPQRIREQNRNRFSGRTRPTTTSTTTEASKPISHSFNQGLEVDPSVASVQPTQSQSQLPRRRPGAGGPFQGRRRQSTPVPSIVPDVAPVEVSDVPIAPTSSVVVSSSADERRASFGKRGRARPNAPTPAAPVPAVDQPINRRPILGRPLRSRGPTTTTTTTEVSEPIVDPTVAAIEDQNDPQPTVEPSPSAIPENIRVEAGPEGIIAQKVTVSSSTTTSESVEPAKRGSAGVLGRIRSRARPLVQTTTVAPVVTPAERKPSRLNGILNRRKSGPGGVLTTTHNPIPEVAVPDDTQVHENVEASQPKPKEIIVSVSSVVTESEETFDHHGDAEEHSSTTQGSILNRLKAQRKPGSLYRKRVES